mmetsp:Transcript_27826/g.50569  ORF Transcript_27826/g.50569 Transcript_27826/m.50569 type:complete len:81 (-) Transcript_27826:76-318(-)
MDSCNLALLDGVKYGPKTRLNKKAYNRCFHDILCRKYRGICRLRQSEFRVKNKYKWPLLNATKYETLNQSSSNRTFACFY